MHQLQQPRIAHRRRGERRRNLLGRRRLFDERRPGAKDDAGVPDSFAWAQAFTAGDGSEILAMAADPSGVVVVGQLTGTATFGSTTLTATNSGGNGFVAKLDPTTGNVLWAKVASGAESIFEAVVIDSSGNVTLSGADYGDAPSVTFAGTTLTPNSASGTIGGNSVSDSAGLIARLDSSGNATWVKMVETTTEIDLGALAISGADVIVAGPLDGDAAFAPGEALPVTGCTMGCVVFAAFDSTGTAKWATIAPSTPHRGNAASNPHQVQAGSDSTGNIYLGIGGYFEGEGSTDANELVANKYDPTGALLWNKTFLIPAANGGEVDLNGFVVDAAGNGSFLFSSAVGLVIGSTTAGSLGLARLSPAGDVSWVQDLDSTAAGTEAIAIGPTKLWSFGNGNDTAGILPDTVVPMTVGEFDPTTGALASLVTCGIAEGQGQTLTVSGTSVYVAGQGNSPGVFGHLATTSSGVFVAKLK